MYLILCMRVYITRLWSSSSRGPCRWRGGKAVKGSQKSKTATIRNKNWVDASIKQTKTTEAAPSCPDSLTVQPLAGAQQETHHSCHTHHRGTHRPGTVAVVRITGADHLATSKASPLIAIVGGGLVLIATGPYHSAIWGHCQWILIYFNYFLYFLFIKLTAVD